MPRAPVGLDPRVGYYHTERPGRPSLALDLMEEFRHPVVDLMVARMVLKGELSLTRGYRRAKKGKREGWYLGPDTRRTLVEAYHRRMKSFRERVLSQADRLRRLVVSGKPYEPYVFT